ncbi:MAG: TIGR03936 family radical SAM-associated protein [Anaerolineales bacterium]
MAIIMFVVQRLRIRFTKTGRARFAGNLDLHKAWERALRRADAPLAYSEGFHPQPRIQLAAALPLGFTSEAEIADVWLEEEVDPDRFGEQLARKLPPGISILSVKPVLGKQKSLQSRLRSACYAIRLAADTVLPESEIRTRVEQLLARTEILREKRGKKYDLRPLIESLQVESDPATGILRLKLRMAAQAGATGRPEEVLAELGLEAGRARIHRTALIFVDNED